MPPNYSFAQYYCSLIQINVQVIVVIITVIAVLEPVAAVEGNSLQPHTEPQPIAELRPHVLAVTAHLLHRVMKCFHLCVVL